jgi:hypothetical protein
LKWVGAADSRRADVLFMVAVGVCVVCVCVCVSCAIARKGILGSNARGLLLSHGSSQNTAPPAPSRCESIKLHASGMYMLGTTPSPKLGAASRHSTPPMSRQPGAGCQHQQALASFSTKKKKKSHSQIVAHFCKKGWTDAEAERVGRQQCARSWWWLR